LDFGRFDRIILYVCRLWRDVVTINGAGKAFFAIDRVGGQNSDSLPGVQQIERRLPTVCCTIKTRIIRWWLPCFQFAFTPLRRTITLMKTMPLTISRLSERDP